MHRRGTLLSLAVAALAVSGLVFLHHDATDFPTASPVAVVDAALVARLRAEPGLHIALAPNYRLDVALDLRDDPGNRSWYGTDIDLREAVPARAIHLQRKTGRLAIHADGHNPRAGLWPAFLHGTVDVPIIPLALVLLFALFRLYRLFRQARQRSTAAALPGAPASRSGS